MCMKWLDIIDIAILLEEKYSKEDNINLRYTDLYKWILGLDEFSDDPKKCNEKILESIQSAWIEERE